MEQAKPTLDRRAADQMNLNVLKRMDPDVEELIATAGHVALYDFDIAASKWSRKDVEGSMFLVKRRSHPRFRFFILNKKSDGTHMEDIVDGFNCEMNGEYVLYRSVTHGEVLGLWFYEKSLAPEIYALLQRIVTTFAAPSAASIGTSAQPPTAAAVPVAPMQSETSRTTQLITSGDANFDDDDETIGGDDFWDKKVKVPEKLPAPGASARSTTNGAQSAFSNGAASGASESNDNALARVFAGMKVALPSTASSQGQAPAPSREASIVAPPPPQMPLLTPQFLLQTQQQNQQQQQQQSSAGAALLEGLRQGSVNLNATGPPPPQPYQGGGPPPGPPPSGPYPPGHPPYPPPHPGQQQPGGHFPPPMLGPPAAGSSNIPPHIAAAHAEDAGRVQGMLRSLAGNEAFCGILASEMKRHGLL